MADFKFSCPHCGQHLAADHSLSGRQTQCPHCKVLIRIPADPCDPADYEPESGMTWGTFVGGGNIAPPNNLSLRPRTDNPTPPPAETP